MSRLAGSAKEFYFNLSLTTWGFNFPACIGMYDWISPCEVALQENMKHPQLLFALIGLECNRDVMAK